MSDYKIDINKVQKFIGNKWKNFQCTCCNENNWHISDEAYELRAFRGGNMVVGGVPIIPVVPVTCNNCGNTIFINAVVSKIIDNNNGNG